MNLRSSRGEEQREPQPQPWRTARCCRCGSCCAISRARPAPLAKRRRPSTCGSLSPPSWRRRPWAIMQAIWRMICARRRSAAAGRPGRGAGGRAAPEPDPPGRGGFRSRLPAMPHPGHQPHLRLPAAGLAAARLCRDRAGALQPRADPRASWTRWYAHIAALRGMRTPTTPRAGPSCSSGPSSAATACGDWPSVPCC